MKFQSASLGTAVMIATGAAIVAWVIAGYGVYKVSADEGALASRFASISSGSAHQDTTSRIHALVQATAQERSELTSAIPADLTTIADAITETGTHSGATVTIGSATAASLPNFSSKNPPPKNLNAIAFVIQADGSFTEVMREAQLLETLPVPAKVTDLDFENAPSSEKTTEWRLTVRLTALTSATVTP